MKSAALGTPTGAAHAKTKQQRDRTNDMNTEIECPGCKTKTVVGHLEWTALTCPNCNGIYYLRSWLKNSKEAK